MSRILVAKTTHSDSITHEQTIISKHLFVSRVVVSLAKKEEKNAWNDDVNPRLLSARFTSLTVTESPEESSRPKLYDMPSLAPVSDSFDAASTL